MKDDQKDQNSGEVGKLHRGILSSETRPTSELNAAPSFTPGPWRIKDSSSPSPHERVRILGADGESVASSAAYRNTREAEANARLIAAAPALYAITQEALPIIKTYIEEIGGCDHSVGICCCDVIVLREQLEAALVLANGQVTNTLASSGESSPSR